VLVVYGHVIRGLITANILEKTPFQTLVDSIIYSFHMPLFFFLSGLFFIQTMNRRGAGGTWLSKVDTVFYPFVLWSILQGTIEVFLSHYTNGDLAMGQVFKLLWQPRAQFWFLYALFLIFTVAVLMYRSRALYLPILGLWAAVYCIQPYLPNFGVGDFLIQNFVFFALGVCFSAYPQPFHRKPAAWSFGLLVLFVASQYVFHITLGRNYIDRDLFSLVVAVIGIGLVVTISMAAATYPVRWVLSIGMMSMHIYLMHILAGSGVRVIMSKFMGIQDPTAHIVAGTLAGIVLPIVAARILLTMNMRFLFEIPTRFSALKRLSSHPPRSAAT
jgi:fucose 4-O-acetylase-like acetyltransferase